MLEALDNEPPVDFSTLDPIEERAASEIRLRELAGKPEPVAAIEERSFRSDGAEIPVRIYRPAGAANTVMFIHGGGWVLGDYPTHRRLVRDLVVESGCCAVFVNYTRTPDAVFPRQIDEIFAATTWVASHGDEINVDGGNLAVVGNSVGGNMTAVTALKAKENGGPKIKSQILMWPIVDADFETDSYQQFGRDRFLSASLMKWMYDMYISDRAKRADIHASPLRASVEQLKGLPPALIQVAENDILRDEGEAYGRMLDEAGVEAATVRYDGAIHDFGLLNALAKEPATRALFRHAAAELKHRLQ